ncbi:MAG: CARDB domain-containing protein [Sulfolobales archaeon]
MNLIDRESLIIIKHSTMCIIALTTLLLITLHNLMASVPSVKYQTITWVDDLGVWIVDLSLYTESPWVMGKLVPIGINAVLRSSPPNGTLYMVARVVSNGIEISSKYIGELSGKSAKASDYMYLVVSNLYFSGSNYGTTYPYKLTIVVEGFRGSKVFRHYLEFPVTISVSHTLVLSDVLINGNPNYYFMFESIDSVNFSVVLRNQGTRNVEWAVVDFYLGKELIGRRYVESLPPGGARSVNVTTFRYFTPGLYDVNVVVRYRLPDGVEDYVNTSGIIEVFKGVKVTLNCDKTSVIEGSQVLFEGKVIPGNKSFVILEKLVDNFWVPLDAVLSDEYGVFRFEWTAKSVDPSINYVREVFRVRVPLSAIGSNASVVSNSVSLTVYSSRRVSDFISDLTLFLEPDKVFTGYNVSFTIKVTPILPICIPVKITYLDPSLYMWFELVSTYVCGGEGSVLTAIKLPPGKYSVKAVLPSTYRVIESLPKPLEVLEIPKVIILNPTVITYGNDLPVTVRTTPLISTSLDGYAYLTKNSEILQNSSISLSNGIADLIFRNVSREGMLTVHACINFNSFKICNYSNVEVVKMLLSISPLSTTVDVNSLVRYSISVTPPGKYELELTISSGAETVLIQRFMTDEYGKALINITAPSKPGNYVVGASIRGTPISVSAKLDVIEFIKSITLELLNKSVKVLDKVYVRVSLSPATSTPQQLIINLQRDKEWEPIMHYMMTSASALISFTAPNIEGVYKVKATIPGSNVESNIETLTVSSTVTTLLPTEYLYAILASAVLGGLLLYLRGRRR